MFLTATVYIKKEQIMKRLVLGNGISVKPFTVRLVTYVLGGIGFDN